VRYVDRAGSDGTSYYRLDKGNLDGGEASPGEDLLDDGGSGNGGVVEEGAGFYTDGEDERTEGLGLPGVGVGEGVDGRPLYVNGVEVVADALADREPSAPNGVTVDRRASRSMPQALRTRQSGPDLKTQGVPLP